MSGKQESAQDSIKLVEEQLDNFLDGLSLKNVIYDTDIEYILNYTASQIRSFSSEECGINAFLLQQYTLYLQKQINRLKSISGWATSNIKMLTAKEGKNYGNNYTRYDERIYLVKSGNTYGKELHKVERKADIHVQELDMIISRVNSMANTLLELQQTKRFNR
jgi:thymidylate synthase